MYQTIGESDRAVEMYAEQLLEEGVVTASEDEEMKAQFQAPSTRSSQQPTATSRTGRLLDGRCSDYRLRRGRGAARRDRRRHRHAERGRPAHHRLPQDFNAHKTIQRLLERRRRWWRPATASTGRWPSSWRSARCSSRASRCGSRPGQPARHLHPAPRGADRPRDGAPLHAAQVLSPDQGRFEVSTRCCPRRRCSASSSATRWPTPMRSSCGRRSSATSPTARR